jgi:hypothetical protein
VDCEKSTKEIGLDRKTICDIISREKVKVSACEPRKSVAVAVTSGSPFRAWPERAEITSPREFYTLRLRRFMTCRRLCEALKSFQIACHRVRPNYLCRHHTNLPSPPRS